jgi:hypothetical protein
MARSDWPLSSRIVVPGVEALWAWTRVLALYKGLREEEDPTAVALYAPLIEKHVRDARGEEPSWAVAQTDDWIEEAERQAIREAERIAAELAGKRAEIAAGFADLDPEQQLWGMKATQSRGSGGRRAE